MAALPLPIFPEARGGTVLARTLFPRDHHDTNSLRVRPDLICLSLSLSLTAYKSAYPTYYTITEAQWALSPSSIRLLPTPSFLVAAALDGWIF